MQHQVVLGPSRYFAVLSTKARRPLPNGCLICVSVSQYGFGNGTALAGLIEHHMDDTGRMKVLVGPSGKRRLSDTFKGRVVVETLVPSVSVSR